MEDILDQWISTMGGARKAAAALNLSSPSVVLNWRSRGRVPADKVLDVERLSGISRHLLRPDIFGPASEAAPPVARSGSQRGRAVKGAALIRGPQ